MSRFSEYQCYEGLHDIMRRNAYDEAVLAVVALENELLSRREEIFRMQTALEEFKVWWKDGPTAIPALSPRQRFETLHRDGFRCRYCGRTPSIDGVTLHVDHLIPRKEGGDNAPSNLVTACQDCNLGKSSQLLVNTPEDFAANIHMIH